LPGHDKDVISTIIRPNQGVLDDRDECAAKLCREPYMLMRDFFAEAQAPTLLPRGFRKTKGQ
jgi:hypothetical protein